MGLFLHKNMKFYRFRSLNNLLGKYKELENQEIYFASPSEQNDPMEGYHEIYYQGDEIVWSNFFKNYLFLLDQVIQDILLSPPKRKYKEPKHLELFYDWDKISSPLKSHLLKIFDSFFAKPEAIHFIKELSKNNRKFSWNEISLYLRTIHLIALGAINEIYNQISQPLFDAKLLDLAAISQFNEEFFYLLDQLSQDERPVIFQLITSPNEQLDLLQHLAPKRMNFRQRFFVKSFPNFFLERIKKLMHRDWYTACFMNEEASQSSSVWGSYGSNHTGICLIFQAEMKDKNYFLSLKQPTSINSVDGISYDFLPLKYHQIDYSRFPSPINFFTSLGELPTPKLVNNWLRSTEGELSYLYHSI